MSASGLHASETVDPCGHVAIVAGVGLELEEHRQRPRGLTGLVEQHAEVVEQSAAFVEVRRGRFGGPLEPLDRGEPARRAGRRAVRLPRPPRSAAVASAPPSAATPAPRPAFRSRDRSGPASCAAPRSPDRRPPPDGSPRTPGRDPSWVPLLPHRAPRSNRFSPDDWGCGEAVSPAGCSSASASSGTSSDSSSVLVASASADAGCASSAVASGAADAPISASSVPGTASGGGGSKNGSCAMNGACPLSRSAISVSGSDTRSITSARRKRSMWAGSHGSRATRSSAITRASAAWFEAR